VLARFLYLRFWPLPSDPPARRRHRPIRSRKRPRHKAPSAVELGADYEGSNNYTYGPPYTIWDAGARIPVAKRVRLQVSVQNLFNLNTGTLLGRALSAQGNVEPTTHTLRPGNGFTYTGNGSVEIQALPPRNVRLSLDLAL
jgi:outer membrane receptor protein involved in Fe transport